MESPFLSSLQEKVDPGHTALIVVDVQNDFCAKGAWFDRMGKDLSQIQAMVPRLLGLIASARRQGLQVVHVRLDYGEPFLSPNMKEYYARKRTGRDLCQPGTWGSEFYLVRPEPPELVLTKHRYDAFEGTHLDLILRSRGIHTVLVTGVTTECCVESTARSAYMKGYYVVLVSDCTATYDPALQEAAERNIDLYFGVLTPSEEIVKIWETSSPKEARARRRTAAKA
jgi:ureidoacrylate peracid hydrolase